MSLNRATLRQLRALAATIRCGSVTGAAHQLNVTPPAISLQLKQLEELAGVAALEAFAIDLAIMGRPPNHFEVDRSTIGPHPHIIVAPPDHPLARQRYIAARALSAETFLMREPGSGTRTLTEQLLADTGATPAIGMEIDSNETIKQAVMAGLGIALLSAHT